MPKVSASGCRAAAASTVTAGVRMAVIQAQSMMAMGQPERMSLSSSSPVVWGRLNLAGLPG